jgi:hypothetical protein
MSVAAAIAGKGAARTTPEEGARGRGRLKVDADPEQRRRHLAVARAWLLTGMTAAEICRGFDISRRTLHYWVKLALGYPEGRHLRRFKRAR